MPRGKIGHFYYSWYPTIYQADTQALTLAEDGAYRRLIDHYMLTRAPILDDDRALARAVGVGIDDWELVKVRVKQYFKPTRLSDGLPTAYLKHDFCDEAIAFDNARIEKARKNGRKGGRITSSKIKGITHSVTEPLTDRSSLPELLIPKQTKESIDKESIEVFALTGEPPNQKIKSKKATRLSESWDIIESWGEWAMNSFNLSNDEVNFQADEFKDYWISRADKGALRLNWEATWRNWIRKYITNKEKNNGIQAKKYN